MSLQEISSRLGELMTEVRAQGLAVSLRLDGIDRRLDGMDARLDGLDGRLAVVEVRLDGIDGRLAIIDGRLLRLEVRADRIETKADTALEAFDVFRESMDRHFAVVIGKLDARVAPLVDAQHYTTTRVQRLDRRRKRKP